MGGVGQNFSPDDDSANLRQIVAVLPSCCCADLGRETLGHARHLGLLCSSKTAMLESVRVS